ncbi:hypothetical protein BZL34_26255 [Escherichia coli]|nr:hypothetical protein BZL34_26255 [Escherichia coli]
MLIFLRQQNGALSVEILYFLARSVMCHPDVVNIAKNDIEINHNCVGIVFYLSSGYGSKPVIVTVLIFYNSGMAHCRRGFCISLQGR